MSAKQTKKVRKTRFYIRATTNQDGANFTLSREHFEAFCAALDAPPRNIPALRKILTGESVFNFK